MVGELSDQLVYNQEFITQHSKIAESRYAHALYVSTCIHHIQHTISCYDCTGNLLYLKEPQLLVVSTMADVVVFASLEVSSLTSGIK